MLSKTYVLREIPVSKDSNPNQRVSMTIYSSDKAVPYVYICTHKETNEFYIGYRMKNVKLNIPSHLDLPEYKTSSTTIRPDWSNYTWTIVAEFFDPSHAYTFEQQLICDNWENPLLLNGHYNLGKNQFRNKGGKPSGRKGIPSPLKGKPSGKKGIPNGRKGIPNGRKGIPSPLKGVPSPLKGKPNGKKGIPTGPNGKKGVPSKKKGKTYGPNGKQRNPSKKPSPKKGVPSGRKGKTYGPSGRKGKTYGPNGRKGMPSKKKGKTYGPTGKQQNPAPEVECPHCGTIGKSNVMKRRHFDNCKKKPL